MMVTVVISVSLSGSFVKKKNWLICQWWIKTQRLEGKLFPDGNKVLKFKIKDWVWGHSPQQGPLSKIHHGMLLNTARKHVQCISTVRFFYQSNKNVNVTAGLNAQKGLHPLSDRNQQLPPLQRCCQGRTVSQRNDILDTSEMCY